ncbi:MAG: nitrate reductase molybdenum cofactor assembly chaperone [Venatoribacter sp.]
MQILKVISLLLDYPTEALQEASAELATAIAATRVISPTQRTALQALLDELSQNELMDVQESYIELFNRGRYLSLLLFEHVHGESRDRGQAMVDLMAEYEKAGFAIDGNELPDYIPLYLEYLSTLEGDLARAGLGDIEHLLALLAARLDERDSRYGACFNALLQIAGVEPSTAVAQYREQVANEESDTTLEALDAVWEEEAVNFMQNQNDQACGGRVDRPRKAKEDVAVPIHWVDFNQASL